MDPRAKGQNHTMLTEIKALQESEVKAFGDIFIKGFEHMPVLSSSNISTKLQEYRLPLTDTPEGWEKLHSLYAKNVTDFRS